jgi:hypothetical protein
VISSFWSGTNFKRRTKKLKSTYLHKNEPSMQAPHTKRKHSNCKLWEERFVAFYSLEFALRMKQISNILVGHSTA